jgi:hypothetical protein
MPNPRYISSHGEPTPELLEKLSVAKQVFLSNLPWFCERYGIDPEVMSRVDRIYLIGSHAEASGWHNDTSDIDFKIVNLSEDWLPEEMHRFRKEVLRPLLCRGEKQRWIDLYFVKRDDQALPPRFDLTSFWNGLESS